MSLILTTFIEYHSQEISDSVDCHGIKQHVHWTSIVQRGQNVKMERCVIQFRGAMYMTRQRSQRPILLNLQSSTESIYLT